MNSLKYYAISFGVLMALTGSVIVLADEVENEPVVLEDKEEVSYVFEDTVETVMEEPEIITSEENVEIVTEDETTVDEVSNPIVVEEVPAENPASGPVLRTPAGEWGSDENGTYYTVSGEKLKDTVTDIDGYYYGFKPTGYIYIDQRFQWNTHWYQAKEDGKLCQDEWYTSPYGAVYCYDHDATGLNGVNNINGTEYYFKDGLRATNTAFDYDGDPYYTDDDGFLIEMMPGWNNFTEANGKVNTYLVTNGTYVRGGVKYYDANYYYFGDNGKLARDTTNYVSANPSYSVRSKKDGTLYVYEWYHEKDYGNSYYYGIMGRSWSGFQTVGGHDYYFATNGLLYQDRAETIDGHVYIFQADGSYSEAVEGWNDTTSYRYYVKDGNLIYSNFIEENGELYYLRPDGRLLVWDVAQCGAYAGNGNDLVPAYCAGDRQGRVVKDEFWFGYYFGPEGRTLSNGFHTIDGYDYYIQQGKYLYATIRNIDGVNYIFDITGAASVAKEGFTTNIYTYYVLDGELANGIYEYNGKECYFIDGIMQQDRIIKISDTQSMVASQDGSLVKNSWYTINSPRDPLYIQGIVFADSEGMLLQGFQIIGDYAYIFGTDEYTPYVLNKNTILTYDGLLYYCNSDGVAILQAVSNGWINKGGNDVFYIRNGKIVKHEILNIEGNEYAIDAYGRLVKNGFWEEYDPVFRIYRTDASGKIIKSAWVQVNDGLTTDGEYYFDENGRGLEDWQTVDGNTFYFDYGRVLSGEIRQINGQLYKFGYQGNQYTTIVPDGVYTEGRCLQVVRNGVLVKNQIYAHEGSYYLIDGQGYSLHNEGIQIMDFVYNRMYPLYLYSTGENALAQFTKISTTGLDFFLASDATVRDGLVVYMGDMYAVVRDEYPYSFYKTWVARNVPVIIKGTYYWADENGVLHQVVENSRHSLSLTGNIGVNFYYSFADVVLEDEDAKVEFTIDDITTSLLIKNSRKTTLMGVTYNVFTQDVTSVQLATKIAAKVILSGGDIVFEEEYAAKDYAMLVINSSTTETDLSRLMKALLIYGGYAQKAFNYNTDNLAYAELSDYDVSDVTAATLQPYAMSTSGSAAGLSYQGSTLALNSLTTINHIFTVSSGHSINEYTFKLGNKTLTPIKRGSKYYVVIPDIYSKDLDTMYTVSVGNYSISYSALSYGYKVLTTTTTSAELKDLMRALYKYNQAANAYFE